MINAYRILIGKPEWKRPLRRLMYRWENSITIHHRETGWDDIYWMNLAQGKDQWWAR
jgi:hypothetical protein